ncbi:MAG TPA: nuclease, partial [Verrucomicrobia bacterium]|nr:nuclease [Verrucomicrobiota bacterium]
ADIKIGSRWINKELIEEGYAWHYKQYSKDQVFAVAESNAKKEAKGLWISHNPVPPWEYRKK